MVHNTFLVDTHARYLCAMPHVYSVPSHDGRALLQLSGFECQYRRVIRMRPKQITVPGIVKKSSDTIACIRGTCSFALSKYTIRMRPVSVDCSIAVYDFDIQTGLYRCT